MDGMKTDKQVNAYTRKYLMIIGTMMITQQCNAGKRWKLGVTLVWVVEKGG